MRARKGEGKKESLVHSDRKFHHMLLIPTGFGKSLCYEILPFVMEHQYNQLDTSKSCAVLVVSPLMVDQILIYF